MKKLLFGGSVIVCFLISCATSKNMKSLSFPPLTPGQDYFGSRNSISEQEALAMIKGFPKHRHRTWGKKKLDNTWAMFDSNDLSKIDSDSNVENIKFVLAAQISKYKDTARYPTIVIRIKLKTPVSTKKPGTFVMVQYLKSVKFCPPPANCFLTN